MQIDFIADVVCPWCYLGWRRLEKALALRPDLQATVTWRPYQLDPTLPEEGVDRKAYYAAKFPDLLNDNAPKATVPSFDKSFGSRNTEGVELRSFCTYKTD